MRKLTTWTGLVLVMGAVLAIGARGLMAQGAPSADEAGVRKAIEAYFQGHATGQGEHFRRGMHADMRFSGLRDGKLFHRNLDEFAGGFPGKPAADEAKRKRRIVNIDITGIAASAKIELDYPDVFFTDYFLLLKVDGEWKIIDKIADSRRRTPAPSASASR
jgi:putative lumazine-binding protein